MMFFAMAILLPVTWFLPWWVSGVFAAWMGWISGPRLVNALQLAIAGGLVTAALAFLKDGRSLGIISQRMSGLFGLPWPPLVFLLVFFLTFVTLFLCFQAGAALSTLYKTKPVSLKNSVPK